MEGIDPLQGPNSLIDSWKSAQNVQLALAAAVMKQGQEVAEIQGEAIVDMIENMPRMDGTGQLVQKSA
jgi:hypothetical protein